MCKKVMNVIHVKKVIIAIHEFTYSGTPLLALEVAKILKEHEKEVYVISLQDGELKKEFLDLGISVFFEDTMKQIPNADILIAFSMLSFPVMEWMNYKLPIVCYIHEGEWLDRTLVDRKVRTVCGLKNEVWCVSEYARKYLERRYNVKSLVQHNFVIDEYKKSNVNNNSQEIKKFLFIGSINERKAPDIIVNAFKMLDLKEKQRCEVHFVGRTYLNYFSNSVIKEVEKENQFIYHGEINKREDILSLYSQMDVVIVPSLDESCSLVTLEAMMMGIPVIISQNVGAKYMVTRECGWIFETGDVHVLYELLIDIINNKYDLEAMGRNARESYLLNATKEIYEKEFIKKINHLVKIPSSLWKIKYLPNRLLWKFYYTYFYNPFENESISRKSKVVLYGAGSNGVKWRNYLRHTKYVDVVAWVDKNVVRDEVIKLENFQNIEYDYYLNYYIVLLI